eukprot:715222-Prymnesium_polylepis.1
MLSRPPPPTPARRGLLSAAALAALSQQPLAAHSQQPLFRAADAASLSLGSALELVHKGSPPQFVDAVLATGRVLYRGEELAVPAILTPAPDLLDAGTYGSDDAARYFERLETCLASAQALARPSTGHIGVARLEAAAAWGHVCSVWPLGRRLCYVYPTRRADFWPCDTAADGGDRLQGVVGGVCSEGYGIDRGLATALVEGHEVLFATSRGSSFVAIPSKVCSAKELLAKLELMRTRRP